LKLLAAKRHYETEKLRSKEKEKEKKKRREEKRRKKGGWEVRKLGG
jgi:hypothetical protein